MAKASARPSARTRRLPDPTAPFGKRPLRTFALCIALPAFVIYVSGAALVLLVLSMMQSDINQLEDGHDVSVMHAATDAFVNGLNDAVVDEGTWSEAYLNVVAAPDPAWMDGTWGSTARSGQGYDTVIVTDQTGKIVFGENAVGALSGNIGDVFKSANSMLSHLDVGISATGDATTVSGFASDKDGPLAVAAISIHQTSATPGQLTISRQDRRILWLAKHVTPDVLQDIASRYQLPLASMQAKAPKDLSLDLEDIDDTVVGSLAWVAARSTDVAFGRSVLVAMLAYVGLGIGLVLGLRKMRRTIVSRAKVAAAGPKDQEAGPVADSIAAAARLAVGDMTSTDSTDGVSANRFNIDYQPIFDLRAETLIGAEALLRWTAPEQTMVQQELLTPAQAAVLLDRIGLLAIRRAADDLGAVPGVTLSMTITPEQLLNPVFAEKLAATLSATGFSARRLQLVIETSLLPPSAELLDAVGTLRRTGVSIAFSGFALGPATVQYVRTGLADRVRLAPGVIAGIDADAAQMALAEASISAAKFGNLAVTVVGITRREEAGKLLRLGCREFQGPLLAPPLPIAGLTALLVRPQAQKAG